MKDKFKLSEENKRDMIDKIKEFFLEEYNEDLGELASQLVLDFFLDNLAPNIYNQAIEDSYLYIKDLTEDLLSLKKVRY